MFDAALRRRLAGPSQEAARLIDVRWVTPDRLTVLGLVLGLLSAVAAAGQVWWAALVLWLTSRIVDGLDGPLARRRATAGASGTAAGGYLDITADFTVYGATVVGVAIGTAGSGASPADWLPFAAVLLAYYVNGTALLAFSSIAAGTPHAIDDGRSLSFLGGLAEGAETIVVHALWLLLPAYAATIATVWAVVVGLGATQRVVSGYRTLRRAVPEADR